MQKLMRRRRRIAITGVLSGALVAAMAFTGTAQAATTTAKNSTIIGSGSNTTYYMMQALDTLFNDALGCYMTQPTGTPQTLNYSCASNAEGNQVGQAFTENPRNDVAFEEPALGSSGGIDQLESTGPGNDGGGTAQPTAPVNFARSSRQFKTSDDPGLNFVGYATDGVSWVSFPKVNGKATPSAKVTNLTTTQLEDIWTGKITNWDKVGGANATICVYTAQVSSGTESTWATAMNQASPTDLNAYVDSLSTLKGCKTPKGISYAKSHTLTENEARSIVEVGDESNAIFFYSYGKFQVNCVIRTALCDDNLSPKTSTIYYGKINGVTANTTTILCDTKACKVPFPVTRDLFNVYSNGSFSPTVNSTYGFPAATAATLNYVSEIGFLCKPQVNTKGVRIPDPTGGSWYRSEINQIIEQQGFIPFPLQKHEDINTVDTPAVDVLKADGAAGSVYAANDPIVANGVAANERSSVSADPSGYCQVWTTDTNTAP